ncbi:MAG: FtsQ-type POTRA domain-containing protein [Treponema sp.]|jgi:cell division protein FtsQ|nr:FtsQ-type POTRA domain-containing protein [Treponema sp.]
MSSVYAAGSGSVPVRDKILKHALAVIAVILGAELLWLFGIRPCMPFSRLEIRGVSNLDDSVVLAAAGIGQHSSFMTVNRKAAEDALASLPMIGSAAVIKHFPSALEIVLEPRMAAAIMFTEIGGRLRPALVDGNGTIFSVDGEGYGETVLPVISGLYLDKAFPGMKLPRLYTKLFGRLEQIARESPELLLAVSEIRINRKNYDGFDLTVFPAHIPVKVRIGPELNGETIMYMLLMLDVLSARVDEIEEIDFRTGTASYILKEAHSG